MYTSVSQASISEGSDQLSAQSIQRRHSQLLIQMSLMLNVYHGAEICCDCNCTETGVPIACSTSDVKGVQQVCVVGVEVEPLNCVVRGTSFTPTTQLLWHTRQIRGGQAMGTPVSVQSSSGSKSQQHHTHLA